MCDIQWLGVSRDMNVPKFCAIQRRAFIVSKRVQRTAKLDESTARRQLKSPRSLSGRSITWPWSPNGHGHGHEWPTATSFVQCQSALPSWDTAISKFDHENPWSRSCVRSKVKVTFDLQNSKVNVMVKVKHIGHIWGLEFNRYVCFLFRGNRTTFGWDIGNSICYLENSRSRSWPRSNLMVAIEALGSIDMFAFRFVAIGPFWLRYSKFYIWPWIFKVKVMIKVKPDGHIWALEFNRYVCFSFRGNRTSLAEI